MKEFQVGLLKRAQGMVVHLTYGRGGSIVTAIVTECPDARETSAAYRMRRMVRAEWDCVELYACTSTANLRLTALMAAGACAIVSTWWVFARSVSAGRRFERKALFRGFDSAPRTRRFRRSGNTVTAGPCGRFSQIAFVPANMCANARNEGRDSGDLRDEFVGARFDGS